LVENHCRNLGKKRRTNSGKINKTYKNLDWLGRLRDFVRPAKDRLELVFVNLLLDAANFHLCSAVGTRSFCFSVQHDELAVAPWLPGFPDCYPPKFKEVRFKNKNAGPSSNRPVGFTAAIRAGHCDLSRSEFPISVCFWAASCCEHQKKRRRQRRKPA